MVVKRITILRNELFQEIVLKSLIKQGDSI